ncbi:MAG: amidase family protein, partial [Caldilinea sp.]|nr:amidase family protein [Caldilinea sp.]
MSKALYELTIHAAWAALQRGDFSAVELTQSLLDRIAQVDGQVNAYLTVTAELALAQAAAADVRRSCGET